MLIKEVRVPYKVYVIEKVPYKYYVKPLIVKVPIDYYHTKEEEHEHEEKHEEQHHEENTEEVGEHHNEWSKMRVRFEPNKSAHKKIDLEGLINIMLDVVEMRHKRRNKVGGSPFISWEEVKKETKVFTRLTVHYLELYQKSKYKFEKPTFSMLLCADHDASYEIANNCIGAEKTHQRTWEESCCSS